MRHYINKQDLNLSLYPQPVPRTPYSFLSLTNRSRILILDRGHLTRESGVRDDHVVMLAMAVMVLDVANGAVFLALASYPPDDYRQLQR